MNVSMLHRQLVDIKKLLSAHFAEDTAYPGTVYTTLTAGHCAAVAAIVYDQFGGEFVSARHEGRSHWFNRIEDFDVDLTGDQYGLEPVRVGATGSLYSGTRVRDAGDMGHETRVRARLLALRAGLLKDGS